MRERKNIFFREIKTYFQKILKCQCNPYKQYTFPLDIVLIRLRAGARDRTFPLPSPPANLAVSMAFMLSRLRGGLRIFLNIVFLALPVSESWNVVRN